MRNLSKILIVLALAFAIYGCKESKNESSKSETQSKNIDELTSASLSTIESKATTEKTFNANVINKPQS